MKRIPATRNPATSIFTTGSLSLKWCPGEGLRLAGREGPFEAVRGRLPAILILIATLVGTRRRRPLYDGYKGRYVIQHGESPEHSPAPVRRRRHIELELATRHPLPFPVKAHARALFLL